MSIDSIRSPFAIGYIAIVIDIKTEALSSLMDFNTNFVLFLAPRRDVLNFKQNKDNEQRRIETWYKVPC